MELAEKTKQVRAMLRRGVPDGEIREDLRREGYSEADIRTIFKPRPYDMRSFYLTTAIIFSLIGLYLLMQYRSRLLLVFAGLMFSAYLREIVRFKKETALEDQ